MKILLTVGSKLQLEEYCITVVKLDDKTVTLKLDNEVEVTLIYEDWSAGRGHLVPFKNKSYLFQSGGRIIDKVKDSIDISKESTSVFFIFRFTEVDMKNATELNIGFGFGKVEVQYSDRLGFKYMNHDKDTILLITSDPFAEQTSIYIILEDRDEIDNIVHILTHTAKNFLLQGQGENNGYFKFRILEVLLPIDNDTGNCNSCG